MKLFKTLLFVLLLNSVGFITTYGQELIDDETDMMTPDEMDEEEVMEDEYE